MWEDYLKGRNNQKFFNKGTGRHLWDDELQLSAKLARIARDIELLYKRDMSSYCPLKTQKAINRAQWREAGMILSCHPTFMFNGQFPQVCTGS